MCTTLTTVLFRKEVCVYVCTSRESKITHRKWKRSGMRARIGSFLVIPSPHYHSCCFRELNHRSNVGLWMLWKSQRVAFRDHLISHSCRNIKIVRRVVIGTAYTTTPLHTLTVLVLILHNHIIPYMVSIANNHTVQSIVLTPNHHIDL